MAWARTNRVAIAATVVSALVAIVIGTRADIRLGDVFLTSLSRWDTPPDDIVGTVTLDITKTLRPGRYTFDVKVP